MLKHRLETQPAVSATFELTPPQAAASLQALRTVRDARYRTPELSTDEVLAMRELTSLVDELAAVPADAERVVVSASVARLGALRAVLEEFAAGEHLEREGDAVVRPAVYALADEIGDLHADAIRAALGAEPAGLP